MKENLIQELSFEFALNAYGLYKQLTDQREYIISRQFFRSATSIGANIYEATAAASRKDFANKMIIASKEARETFYWLRLLKEGKVVSIPLDDYIKDIDRINRIITSIVKTLQNDNDK